MDKLTRITTDDRDNLAAYLDGELDENTTRRIETLLTKSSVARNDVELLARTYDLLELLPRPSAPEDFTEKTIATAKLEGYRKPLTQQSWYRMAARGSILAGWTVALVLMGAWGYALTTRWIPQEDDLLLDDYPIVKNLDVYSEVKDIGFLRELTGHPQLLEDIRGIARP